MIVNMDKIELNIFVVKTVFINILIYVTYLKIANIKIEENIINKYFFILKIIVISIISVIIREKVNSTIFLISVFFLFIFFEYRSKDNYLISINHIIIFMSISFVINYGLLIITSIIIFVLSFIIIIKYDYINLALIMLTDACLVFYILNISKIKNGMIFIQERISKQYINIFISNILCMVLFIICMLVNSDINIVLNYLPIAIIIILFIFYYIREMIDTYYKQKLLIQDFEQTKQELEDKKEEIKTLEQENLNFSKKTHSLVHKQKALEYKLNQIILNNITVNEKELRDELNILSSEIYTEQVSINLPKTEINNIDDMLLFLKAECASNKIEFNLQLNGNIFYMVNNIVSKEELEILIADHVKDAIIAINHSDNINRSILVKLGLIENFYELIIYDSGIELKNETLLNLGKKPVTTYKEEGGTGMGFMNTFDTLYKYNASLYIKHIGKPCKENYTKFVQIKFDGLNKYEWK